MVVNQCLYIITQFFQCYYLWQLAEIWLHSDTPELQEKSVFNENERMDLGGLDMHIIFFFYFCEVFLVCFYSPSNTTNQLLIFTNVPSPQHSRHPRTLNSEFECLQSCQQSGTISFSRFTGAPSFSGVISEDTTKNPTIADLKILQRAPNKCVSFTPLRLQSDVCT